jgi:hypothetical protein
MRNEEPGRIADRAPKGALWIALLLSAAIGACGKSSSSPTDGGHPAEGGTPKDAGSDGPSIATACGDLAQALCAKRMSCSSVNVALVYGDLPTCVARETLSCANALASPGEGDTPAMVEACASAYAAVSCADYHQDNPPAACNVVGPRATGMACTFDGQCASDYCSGNKNALCGTCSAPPAAGASCVNAFCGHDQECVDATMLCQTYGAATASCSADLPCGDALSCTGATTTVAGTCQTAEASGAACGGTLPGCDGFRGFFCAGATGAKTCVPISYVTDGMPCGDQTSTFVQCTKGSCYTSTGLATGTQVGTCKANAADGAGCDPVLGPACTFPARCVSGADGGSTCVVPTGANCG